MLGVNELAAAAAENEQQVWQLKQTAQYEVAITQGQLTRQLIQCCLQQL